MRPSLSFTCSLYSACPSGGGSTERNSKRTSCSLKTSMKPSFSVWLMLKESSLTSELTFCEPSTKPLTAIRNSFGRCSITSLSCRRDFLVNASAELAPGPRGPSPPPTSLSGPMRSVGCRSDRGGRPNRRFTSSRQLAQVTTWLRTLLSSVPSVSCANCCRNPSFDKQVEWLAAKIAPRNWAKTSSVGEEASLGYEINV